MGLACPGGKGQGHHRLLGLRQHNMIVRNPVPPSPKRQRGETVLTRHRHRWAVAAGMVLCCMLFAGAPVRAQEEAPAGLDADCDKILVIADFESESEQAALLKELESRGIRCRLLIA